MSRPLWFNDALCVGKTNMFFPRYNERPTARKKREQKAIQICLSCPVKEPCRQYARTHSEYGVWGAETEYQRQLAGYIPVKISIRNVY